MCGKGQLRQSIFAVIKQINDKERIAAAMENPNLKEIVANCLKEPEYTKVIPWYLELLKITLKFEKKSKI